MTKNQNSGGIILREDTKHLTWIKIIGFILLGITGVILRSVFITKISIYPDFIKEALIQGQTGLSFYAFDFEKIYSHLFSLFFSLVGNKIELSLYLQMIIQVISIMVLFLSFRTLFNRIEAWIFFISAILLPVIIQISVEQFFLVIFSFIMGAFALFFISIRRKETPLVIKAFESFILAILLTYCIWVDSVFSVYILLGFFVSVIYTSADAKSNLKQKIVVGSSYLLGIFLSFTLYFIVQMIMESRTFFSILENELSGIFILSDETNSFIFYAKNMISDYPIVFYGILAIFTYTCILSMYSTNRKQALFLILAFGLCLLHWTFLKSEIIPYIQLVIFLYMIAICGIRSTIDLYTTKEWSEKEILEENFAEEEIPVELQVPKENETSNSTNLKKEKTFIPIENPLPGPKKHVSKKLEYNFEPAPEDMHYKY